MTVGSWLENVRGGIQERLARVSTDRTLNWQFALSAVALGLFAVLSYQVSRRVAFRWDLFIWSESPFLTNMMKLTAGVPIYTSPSDANSFVYSPGLEYLTFGVLRPFGAQLDIRFCRAVNVGIAILACASAGAVCKLLVTELGSSQGARRTFWIFAALACALVIGKNYTADVCHPDNLVTCHAVVTLLLCQRAVQSRSSGAACVAVGFAALGPLAKQTGFVMGVCSLAALACARREFRSFSSLARLLPITLIVSALALLPLLRTAAARFWTFELLSQHAVEITKFAALIRNDVLLVPHRALLFASTPFALAALLLQPADGPRRFARLWLVLGIGVLPTLAAYFKALGANNNLTILDVWALMIVLPVLWRRAEVRLSAAEWDAAAPPIGALLLLLVTCPPLRMPPSKAHQAFGQKLEREVVDACARGERVLLGHGAMPLIRGGCGIPLDRANSFLELDHGKFGPHQAAVERLRSHYYQRIVLNVRNWYGGLGLEVEANYRRVDTIAGVPRQPGALSREPMDIYFGYQVDLLDPDVGVYVPRD